MVTISGRRPEKLHAVTGSIGDACRPVVGDVTVDADRRAMVTEARQHGNGRIDVLVNNAGNMYRGPLAELDEQALLDVFHSNVIAAMMLTQAALDDLEGQPCLPGRVARRVARLAGLIPRDTA